MILYRIIKALIAITIVVIASWILAANYFFNSSCDDIRTIAESDSKALYLRRWGGESFINDKVVEWFTGFKGVKIDLPFIIESLGDEWKLDLEYLGLDQATTKVEVNFDSTDEILAISIGSQGNYLTILKKDLKYDISYNCFNIGEADHR